MADKTVKILDLEPKSAGVASLPVTVTETALRSSELAALKTKTLDIAPIAGTRHLYTNILGPLLEFTEDGTGRYVDELSLLLLAEDLGNPRYHNSHDTRPESA